MNARILLCRCTRCGPYRYAVLSGFSHRRVHNHRRFFTKFGAVARFRQLLVHKGKQKPGLWASGAGGQSSLYKSDKVKRHEALQRELCCLGVIAVQPMLSRCSANAQPMIIRCSADAEPMLSRCSANVQPMFSHCSAEVQPMFSRRERCSADD